MGIMQMAAGFGREITAKIMVDSSAALAVTQRKGNGKLRHVRIGQMWVQQMAEEEELTYSKVKGEDNPADVCTKHLNRGKLDWLLPMTNLHQREGRADLALQV